MAWLYLKQWDKCLHHSSQSLMDQLLDDVRTASVWWLECFAAVLNVAIEEPVFCHLVIFVSICYRAEQPVSPTKKGIQKVYWKMEKKVSCAAKYFWNPHLILFIILWRALIIVPLFRALGEAPCLGSHGEFVLRIYFSMLILILNPDFSVPWNIFSSSLSFCFCCCSQAKIQNFFL